jgi:hypothetical protein
VFQADGDLPVGEAKALPATKKVRRRLRTCIFVRLELLGYLSYSIRADEANLDLTWCMRESIFDSYVSK